MCCDRHSIGVRQGVGGLNSPSTLRKPAKRSAQTPGGRSVIHCAPSSHRLAPPEAWTLTQSQRPPTLAQSSPRIGPEHCSHTTAVGAGGGGAGGAGSKCEHQSPPRVLSKQHPRCSQPAWPPSVPGQFWRKCGATHCLRTAASATAPVTTVAIKGSSLVHTMLQSMLRGRDSPCSSAVPLLESQTTQPSSPPPWTFVSWLVGAKGLRGCPACSR